MAISSLRLSNGNEKKLFMAFDIFFVNKIFIIASEKEFVHFNLIGFTQQTNINGVCCSTKVYSIDFPRSEKIPTR